MTEQIKANHKKQVIFVWTLSQEVVTCLYLFFTLDFIYAIKIEIILIENLFVDILIDAEFC